MCFVTKGEKLLVEKDITLEDFITIKVSPVCILFLAGPLHGLGRASKAGGFVLLAPASALKGREKRRGCRGLDIMMELSRRADGCKG